MLVVPHPHSGQAPYVVPEYDDTLDQPAKPQLSGQDSSEPWSPFRTREDFEQAELFALHSCSDVLINGQLSLIRRACGSETKITLQSAKELHELLETGREHEDLTLVSEQFSSTLRFCLLI